MCRMRIRWTTWIEGGCTVDLSVSQILKSSRNITARVRDANQCNVIVAFSHVTGKRLLNIQVGLKKPHRWLHPLLRCSARLRKLENTLHQKDL